MDGLGITLLVIAAVFMALKQGFVDIPQLGERVGFLKPRGWWNYIPIILVALAGLVWISPIRVAEPESVVEQLTDAASVAPATRVGANYLPQSVAQDYFDLMSGEHTDLQEKEFLTRNSGKKIELRLEVASVTSNVDQLRVQFRAGRNPDVFVYFDQEWERHLVEKNPGDSMHFVARIAETRPGRFELVEAEPI